MEFGDRIRAIRQDRGLTQEELAHRAGMSLKSVYFIETGRSQDPHYSPLTSIASALGVDLVELLDSPKAEAPTSATSREVEDRRMTEPGAEDLVEYRTWARIVVDRLNNDRRKALSERE